MFRACFATILSITLLISWPAASQETPPLDYIKALNLPKIEASGEIPPVLVSSLHGTKEPLSAILQRKRGSGPILLHLWAPNCAPCIPEIKALDSVTPLLEQQGLTVIVIAEDHDGSVTVPAFIRRHSLTGGNHYIDETRTLLQTLMGASLPSTYLISPDNKIIAGQCGAIDWSRL